MLVPRRALFGLALGGLLGDLAIPLGVQAADRDVSENNFISIDCGNVKLYGNGYIIAVDVVLKAKISCRVLSLLSPNILRVVVSAPENPQVAWTDADGGEYDFSAVGRFAVTSAYNSLDQDGIIGRRAYIKSSTQFSRGQSVNISVVYICPISKSIVPDFGDGGKYHTITADDGLLKHSATYVL